LTPKALDKLFLNTPYQPDMVELTSNFVPEAAKSGTIEHIVKLSVLGAEAEPGITISRLHRQADKIIEESGIPYTCVQVSSCRTSISLAVVSDLRVLFTFQQGIGTCQKKLLARD
jgi:hypothetical protein